MRSYVAVLLVFVTVASIADAFQAHRSMPRATNTALLRMSGKGSYAEPTNINNQQITTKAKSAAFLAASLVAIAAPSKARAGFFQSAQQDAVDEISRFQAPVAELLDSLRPTMQPNAIGVFAVTQLLKGGKEDSDVVANYMSNYIKPCQMKMEKIAAKMALEGESQKRLEILPQLMKGHIIELTLAIKSEKAEEQAKEVEEVQETLAEFLKLASDKYKVVPYAPARPLTDKDYMGPLGCEFWGKKRIEGSNKCEPIVQQS